MHESCKYVLRFFLGPDEVLGQMNRLLQELHCRCDMFSVGRERLLGRQDGLSLFVVLEVVLVALVLAHVSFFVG